MPVAFALPNLVASKLELLNVSTMSMPSVSTMSMPRAVRADVILDLVAALEESSFHITSPIENIGKAYCNFYV
ncbi:MAG: hypothetical protein ABSH15_16730, partial [Verrucomicrobiota bacterium]|jgi:hypothetical protein